MRSNQIKEVHTIQEVLKNQKEEKLDKTLNEKYQ